MQSSSDYYALLQIDKKATQNEIKRAYRTIALQLHPDVNPDPGGAEHFKLVSAAYAVLSDPAKRHVYDLTGMDPGARSPQAARPWAGGQPGSFRGCGRGRRCKAWMWESLLRKR